MAAEGAKLAQAYVQIVPSMKGVGKAISEAFGGASETVGKSEGGKLGGGLTAGLSSKFGVVSGIASSVAGKVIDAFAGLSGEIVEASDSAQKFGSTLSFAGVSSKQIKALTASTQEYADKTVFSLSDIRNTTAQLASNGVPNYDRLAQAAGNLTAVAGGGANEFRSVAMMLTQTAGAGKLTTENWNQLADAIPGASGKLQEAMKANGAYTGNFRDAMAKGEITADEFNKAIMDLGMTDVAQQAATSTKTIEGSFGNLQAAAVKAGSTVLDAVKPMVTNAMNGVSDAISAATPVVQNAIKGTVDWFKQLYDALRDNGALDTFKNVWKGLADAIKPLGGLAVNWSSMLPPDVAASAVKAVADALQWFVDHGDLVSSAIAGVGGAFAGLRVAGLAGTIGGIAGNLAALQTSLAALQTSAAKAGGGIKGLSTALGIGPWGLIAAAIGAVVLGLVWFFTQTETGRQAWQAFVDWLTPIWNNVLAAWTPIWQQIQAVFSVAWTAIQTLILPILQAIWTAISTVIMTIVGFIQANMGTIQAVWNAVWGVIASYVQGVWNIIQTVITTVLGVIQGIIQTVTALIKGDWQGVWQGIGQIASSIWDGIKGVVSAAINMVRNIIGNVLNGISAVWNAVWGGISSFFSGIWNGIKTAASNGINAVVDTVTGIKDRIVGFFSGAGSWLVSAGRNLLKGLWKGIRNAVGWVVSQISSIKDAIVGGIKSLFGIHSPSRVMRDEVGVMIGKGLAVGLEQSAGVIQRAADDMLPKIGVYAPKVAIEPQADAWDATGYATLGVQGAGVAGGVASADVRTDDERTDDERTVRLLETLVGRFDEFVDRRMAAIIRSSQPEGLTSRDFGRLVRNAVA